MKALVTGGAGFIGSHLCQRLLVYNVKVICLDSLICGRVQNLDEFKKDPSFTFVQADIRDQKALESAMKGVNWVFHLAGLADIVPSIENPSLYFDTNVHGTLQVLECARKMSINRFLYAASSSSYGIPATYPTQETAQIDPQYPYALTKYQGEELVLHWAKIYKLPAVSLRLFNVYGTRSRTTGAYGAVFGVFLAQKLNGEPFTVVGDGTQTRDFTYVTDVADAFISAAKSKLSGEFFNVGSGNHYSINQLTVLLGGDTINIPKRPGEPDCTFADVSKINLMLGWKAKVSLEEGVKKMLTNIEDWRDAPVWNPGSIELATSKWFKYLGDKVTNV